MLNFSFVLSYPRNLFIFSQYCRCPFPFPFDFLFQFYACPSILVRLHTLQTTEQHTLSHANKLTYGRSMFPTLSLQPANLYYPVGLSYHQHVRQAYWKELWNCKTILVYLLNDFNQIHQIMVGKIDTTVFGIRMQRPNSTKMPK